MSQGASFPEDDPVRVLVVDDHDLLAESLVVFLRSDGFAAQRVPTLTATAILEVTTAFQPRVVLLDLHLDHGLLGTTLIAPLRAAGASVVVMTAERDRARWGACIAAGALSVVSKSDPLERLVDGVREAIELRSLMTPAQRDSLLSELHDQRAKQAERRAVFAPLTTRERAVLAGLMDGKTADELAGEHVVSVATVRSQIHSVLSKLGVRSQIGAVALARRLDWRDD